MKVNPLAMGGIKLSNLRLLSFIAADSEPAGFWLPMLRACREEEAERSKPSEQRREIVFEIPNLSTLDAGVVRNELTLLVNRMERTIDHDLILLLAGIGLALGEQVSAAVAAN